MPNPALIQNEACEEWNIPNTNHQWGLIDHVKRKFVSVEISEDMEECKQKFMEKAVDIQENTSLVMVMPISVNVKFLRMTLRPLGASKVGTLLSERKVYMGQLGLMETEPNFIRSLEPSILCSSYINPWCTTWL